jgi:predicted Zn-dependent protease
MITRQKLLLLVICLSLVMFWRNLSFDALYATTSTGNKEIQTGDTHNKLPRNLELYAADLAQYLNAAGHEPFSRSSEKKRLPPVALSLPEIDLLPSLRLPPLPAPSPCHWGRLLLPPTATTRATVLKSEEITTALSRNTPQVSLGSFAKELKSKAHDDDIVRMQNGREWRGKILKETATEVILSVPGPLKAFNLPRERIAEISLKLTLDQVIAQEIKKIAPDDAVILLKFANACAELNLTPCADDLYRQVLAKFPAMTDGYLAYAGYYLALGDREHAYRIYLRARHSGLSAEEIKYVGAAIEVSLGLHAKALDTLAGARQQQTLLLAIECAFTLGRREEMQRLLSVLGNRSNEVTSLYMSAYWKARLALDEGDIGKCRKLCEEIKPEPPSLLLNLLGVTSYLQGDYAQAEESLRKAGTGGHNEAWYNLALVYAAQGDTSASLELLKNLYAKNELVKNMPGQEPFFSEPASLTATLAYVSYQDNPQQNYEQSLAYLQQATSQTDRAFFIAYMQGVIEEQRGEQGVTAAYICYQRVLASEFDFGYVLTKLAALAILQNKHADAAHYLQELSQRHPLLVADTVLASDLMAARLALLRGDFVQARQRLGKLTEQRPTAKSAWKMFIWLYNKTDEMDKAYQAISQVLALDSQDTYTLEAQQQIRDNRERVQWEESFNRQDGETLRRRWNESESKGVSVILRGGKAVLGGRELAGGVPTTFCRLVEDAKLISFSGKMDSGQAQQATTGIFLATTGAKPAFFYFGKNDSGVVVYAIHCAGESARWEIVQQRGQPMLWPDGVHRLTIMRSRDEGFALLLDDVLLDDHISFGSKDSLRLQAGFFGMANSGVVWSCSVDDAILIEKQQS